MQARKDDSGNILKLIQDIENGDIITDKTFDMDIDRALDERDESEEFENQWLQVHKTLKEYTITQDEKQLLDQLRKAAFQRSIKISGNPEIAGYVSEDFGLIGKSLIVQHENSWLRALWNSSYSDQCFPHGDMIWEDR